MIEHAQIEVRPQKSHDAVRFHDATPRSTQFFAQPGHGGSQVANSCANPQRTYRARREKACGIGTCCRSTLFAERDRMLIGLTVAGLAIGGAEAVAELRDLEGSPLHLGQSRDDRSRYRRLPYTARVPPYHDDRHTFLRRWCCYLGRRASRANVASSFK